jgi:redox-sensitive bicupin YhaK (pirin superfamily)
MPAAQPADILVLPRVPEPPATEPDRPVVRTGTAHRQLEGAGFPVRRPFPGAVAFREADPFLLLDHIGPIHWAPREARGAPWHPHRGFETVTYILDGAMRHTDSHGGGGLIRDGDTQWMTAGSGILHDEMPPEDLFHHGGLFHGTQLWVNLPRRLKWTPPRYQEIPRERVLLLASQDGGALVRVIAGELAGHRGPGVTWTPIDYLHVSLSPGARLRLPWRPDFSALAYVLVGSGQVGAERVGLRAGQVALFGPGRAVTVWADRHQDGEYSPNLEILVLGGLPIREPIVQWGPFVMNTREEIVQAVEDFQRGRMGSVPATPRFGSGQAPDAQGAEPGGEKT